MISFGPITSRRLGKSLGINNIPAPKTCSYSCIYCQVGATHNQSATRRSYYDPEFIFKDVQQYIELLNENDKPDYLTFVANGEPTLDINIGRSIALLKTLNIPVAVITNASLLSEASVREDIKEADWVSVKIDAGNNVLWRAINKPVASLDFEQVISGVMKFAEMFKGNLMTETMLVRFVNDTTGIFQQIAGIVAKIQPETAYLSVPTRPPALQLVQKPDEQAIIEAFQIFSEKISKVVLLLGFEGTNIGYTGNIQSDILSICAVHPVREDTMEELLRKNRTDRKVLESLINKKLIKQVSHHGMNFYVRQFQ
ncbi:MAG TPA: radical SAM protein [Bacteroidales bacterium]|nr:radical SAM protein [Bacteroidales bacterium]